MDSRKDRRQPVVILLRDWVELVVVATGAVDGEADGRGDHLGRHVIEIAGAGGAFEDIALRLDVANEIPWTTGQEPCGHNRIRVIGVEEVPGDLLAKKLVVWL